MAPRTPRTSISVCSGVGGLDIGLSAACGMEPVVYIEREAFAAACLVARMEEAKLASAPIWDDVCTFDARPWRGLVDLVAGGTPCQDLSLAGKRAGLDGSRSQLFFEHVRIAVECEAPFFFWENVAGATRVVPRICEYLAERGYRGAWAVVRASDVGAPHKRARVFLLAYSECYALRHESGWGSRQDWPGSTGRRFAGARLADAKGVGRNEGRTEPAGFSGGPDASERGCAVADAERQGLALGACVGGDTREEQQAVERGGLPRFPPGPDDPDTWSRILASRPDLAPAQPRIRRVADGLAGGVDSSLRTDRLRACGNGVVPAQAARAWRGLWRHLFGT